MDINMSHISVPGDTHPQWIPCVYVYVYSVCRCLKILLLVMTNVNYITRYVNETMAFTVIGEWDCVRYYFRITTLPSAEQYLNGDY